MNRSIFALCLLLSGCAFISEVDESDRIDEDKDGTIWLDDCDDNDAGVGVTVWYADVDGDGYGDPNSTTESCEKPNGSWIDNQADCDDTDADIYINAPEICDEKDNDCDDVVDDADENVVENSQNIFLLDTDGDGYPLEGSAVLTCSTEKEDFILVESLDGQVYDCDDTNPDISPADADEDGFTNCDAENYDCDDTNPDVSPSAIEICDMVDNNCDGVLNEDLPTTHYLDADGDGFGDENQGICVSADEEVPEGYIEDSTDCNDSIEVGLSVYPQAEEVCDELDNDCDGEIDENVQKIRYYDADGDGYGDENNNVYMGCEEPVDLNYVTSSGDCDDSNSDIHPQAQERCYDSQDNNCDNLIDEVVGNAWNSDVIALLEQDGAAPTLWYLDADEDGYGTNAQSGSVYSCFNPTTYTATEIDKAYVAISGDCDDNDEVIHPLVNESTGCYEDADNDGYGDENPSQGIDAGTDCNDNDDTVNPDANEICDGQDNDCDDLWDNGEVDNDGDGYFECAVDANGWDGASDLQSGDCDDNDENTYPGAAHLDSETACMTDEDGDGYGDENPSQGIDAGSDCDDSLSTGIQTHPNVTTHETDNTLCYRDEDGDGYGDGNPSQGIDAGTDCNDGDASFYPTAPEECDGVSTSCSQSLPTDEVDDDGDGYVECVIAEEGWQGETMPIGGGDCDDTPATVDESNVITDIGGTQTFPGAAENETQLDPAACVSDNDEDGYAPTSDNGTDCDDTPATVDESNVITDIGGTQTFPGAAENETQLDPAACVSDNDEDGYAPTSDNGTDCDDSVESGAQYSPLEKEVDPSLCYLDADGDGYGDSFEQAPMPETAPVGLMAGSDCDDNDSLLHPLLNEGSATDCYLDADEDGYGDENPPDGIIAGTDCNDEDASFYPTAPEECDGISTSCSQSLPSDEIDDDGDGYVECDVGIWKAEGDEKQGGDCNDDSNLIYPFAPEICDGLDNDCQNGIMSQEQDDDGDGYVECVIVEEGWQGETMLTGGGDCDDTPATVDESNVITDVGGTQTFPGAAENEMQLAPDACVSDNDEDGYAPTSDNGTDCDDSDPQYSPLEKEVEPSLCYLDADGDGYGDSFEQAPMPETAPVGLTAGSDCDDSDPQYSPLENELDPSLCYFDSDGDGYGDENPPNGITAGTDCDDVEADVNPSALEFCDGLDNDCDPLTDESQCFNTDGELVPAQ